MFSSQSSKLHLFCFYILYSSALWSEMIVITPRSIFNYIYARLNSMLFPSHTKHVHLHVCGQQLKCDVILPNSLLVALPGGVYRLYFRLDFFSFRLVLRVMRRGLPAAFPCVAPRFPASFLATRFHAPVPLEGVRFPGTTPRKVRTVIRLRSAGIAPARVFRRRLDR